MAPDYAYRDPAWPATLSADLEHRQLDRLWRGMSRGVTRAACLQFEERLQCARPLHHLGDDARAALCEEARAGPPQRVAAISDCRAAPVFYFFSV